MWPAFWNGYPLVFSDTGTYLSQAIEHYVGWDRPPFYSLFLLPLHLTLTTWPAIAVQALLAASTLHLVRRVLWPDSSAWWLLPITLVLAITTALPWFVAQLMPDVFTGLLVLVLSLLVFAPERLTRWERLWLVAFATFMLMAHQSHLPLALGLLLVLLPLRRWFGAATPLGWIGCARLATPLMLAVLALISVNLLTFGRASLSPFGNVFLLARIIYDGPGMDVLRRDCPASGWRLCAFIDRMPATSDEFLWRTDGPVVLAGGAKLVSSDANAIISAALRTEPGTELRAVARNTLAQLERISTGDGLQAWPITVSPWIERDFPGFEFNTYAASRQSHDEWLLPQWLNTLHYSVALLSVAGLLLVSCRRNIAGGLAVATLLALLINAVVTGGLSTPHDRYQSRLMWLPTLVLVMAALGPVGANITRHRQHNSSSPTLRVIPNITRHPRESGDPGSSALSSSLPWLHARPRCHHMTRTHAANVFWSGSEAAISAVLSFASAFIVARLVGPAEVGIGASVVAVHVLLWVTVNALFADALVQRSALDNTTFSSAVMMSIAVGCVAALAQAGAGQPLRWALTDHRLIAMSLLLAVPLPLVGAAGPVQGLLTRDRAYKTLAFRTMVGQGLGTLVGIACALSGAGAWALVWQQFVISGVGALALLVRCPQRPGRTISWPRLCELLRIGVPLTASTLIYHGRYRLFALLIGGTAGAAALGQVHMAFRLIDAVRELAFTAQWRLMLPLLSERQHDLPRLHAAMDRCLAWSSVAVFPLCAAMAVAIQPLVALLLGPVWQPSGDAALPLVALAAWLFLAFPAGVAVVACGVPRYTLIANIAGTTATALGVLLIRPTTPLHAVLVWLGAQAFISPYVLFANARVLGTTPLRPLRAGMTMLATSLLATAVAFAMPQLASHAWSLVLRLSIVASICSPFGVSLGYSQINLRPACRKLPTMIADRP